MTRLLLSDENERDDNSFVTLAINEAQRNELVLRGLIHQCTGDCDDYTDEPQITYHYNVR